jgi:glycosyltransferase involved in cell wall biosynthesis
MTTLLDRLKKRPGVKLAVVTADLKQDDHFESNGVEYYLVKGPWYAAIQARLGSLRPEVPSKCRLSKYASIVKAWNPDVVHVHGTERDYGLLKSRERIDKPVVVSIQGVMAAVARKACGELLPREMDGVVRSAIGYRAFCINQWQALRAKVSTEEEILKSVDMVLGRTEWDRAWAWALNPNGRYKHVEELMRPEFFAAQAWTLEGCSRHQVFCTSAAQPLKGLHVLIEAVARLRYLYPDIRLHVACGGFAPHPANSYARFILRLVNRLGLQHSVTFLGWMEAGEQVEQLRQAHCFVTPSFIENGCNALQEAMLVGTPSIATSAGGLLTTIEAERTGLNFPGGDVALLARRIDRLFCDDDLASRLGSEARMVARARHEPDSVERQLIAAYEEAIAQAARTSAGEKAIV